MEEQNSYFEYVKSEFLKAIDKKHSIEKDFNESRTSEYKDVCKELADAAAELIKGGIPCINDKDLSIGILVDEVIYNISKEDIKEVIGDARFNAVIKQAENNENEVDSNMYKRCDESFDISTIEPPHANKETDPVKAFMDMLQSTFGGKAQDNVDKIVPTQIEQKDELQTILDDINAAQKKIFIMSQKKDDKIAEVEDLKQTVEILKLELTDREEQYAAEIAEFEKKISSVNEDKDSVECELLGKIEELDEAKAKISSLEKSVNELSDVKSVNGNLKKEIESLNHKVERMHDEAVENSAVTKVEVSNAKDNVKKAESRLAEAEKRNEQLSKEKDSLQKKIDLSVSNFEKEKETLCSAHQKEIDEKVKELNRIHSAELAKVKEESSKNSDAEVELAKVKEELEKVKVDKNFINDELGRANATIHELREASQEVEELRRLAYTDVKTDILNNNAFNRDFNNVDLQSVILTMIGIRNMRAINAERGRNSGDKVIKIVGHELLNAFGREQVYRVGGDQFAILSQNTNLNNVKGEMVDVYNKLITNENIVIVYGSSLGINCSKHKELIMNAEREMNIMKSNPVQSKYEDLQAQVVSRDDEEDIDEKNPEEIDAAFEDFVSGR